MAKSNKTSADLAARFKQATSTPAEPTQTKPKKSAPSRSNTTDQPASTKKQPTRVPNRRPTSPDATATDRFPVRVNLWISEEQQRALVEAKLDDGINSSARIRGALEYWMEGRPQPEPETGEAGKTGRQTKAIDLRARQQRA